MALGHIWAGNAFGTHAGKLFMSLEGDDALLNGKLHLNEVSGGIIVYEIKGDFDGQQLKLNGTASFGDQGNESSKLNATATLQSNGNLQGLWDTDSGAAGTFRLFPHDGQIEPLISASPDQIHTANFTFGPIQINREQLISLGEELQRDFGQGRVVVTFVAGTEQTRYLEDFKMLNISSDRAEIVKLSIRIPDVGGIDKIVTVEFGQTVNMAMAQGANEPWALGQLEKLKREIKKFERVYFARKGFGIVFNQIMFLWMLVILPSLPTLLTRVFLALAVVFLAFCVNWLLNKYLPHSTIYLNEPKNGRLGKFIMSSVSFLVVIAANAIAGLLAAYLYGWFKSS